jgi:WD40 repeat protein
MMDWCVSWPLRRALSCVILTCALGAEAALAQPPDGILRGHAGSVFMGVFAPDGERVVTVSGDETARCWEVATGREVARFKGHTGPVYAVAVSGDGSTLVTGGQDNALLVWDMPRTRPLWTVPAHAAGAIGLARTTDDARWLTFGSDKQIRIWDVAQLKTVVDSRSADIREAGFRGVDLSGVDLNTLSSPRSGHEQSLTAAALRADGALLASGDADGKILVWSPFVPEVQVEFGIHTGGVAGLAFHADNQHLVSVGRDGTVRMWQATAKPPEKATAISSPVHDLVLVQDQAVAAVACDDQVVRVVDLNTGMLIRELPRSEEPLRALAVARNGAFLAAAGPSGTVRLRNFADGSELRSCTGHQGAVSGLVFHPDNASLFSAGADGTVRQWLTAPPEGMEDPIRVFEGNSGGAEAIVLSADGSRLLVGGGDGNIRIFQVADGQLERTLTGHTGKVSELVLSADGKFLFSAGRDKTLRHWDWSTGASERVWEQPAAVVSLSLSANGQRLAAFAEDGRTRVLDVASGEPLQEFGEHASGTGRVRWISDNLRFVTGASDGALHVAKPAIVRTFRPAASTDQQSEAIVDMLLFQGGSNLFTCDAAGHVRMHELSNGQLTREFTKPAAAGVNDAAADASADAVVTSQAGAGARSLALRSDNQRLAGGTGADQVLLWNTGDGNLLQTLPVEGAVMAVAWSFDNQKLAVATDQKKLHFFGPPLPPQSPQPGKELIAHGSVDLEAAATRLVWDPEHRRVLATHEDGRFASWSYAAPVPRFRLAHGGPVLSAAISRDGRMAVSASGDQSVRVWDTTTGQQRAQLNGHVGQVLALALSPDESAVVSSGSDRTLRLWDVTGGKPLKQLATFEDALYSVAYHPAGQMIAAGGSDRRVYLVDVLTGATQRMLEGHTDYIHSVQFHPSGNKLLSYSYAGDLRGWDVGSGGALMQQRIGRIGNFASYSPDGTRVLLANGDDTARVVDLPAEAR